MNKITSINLSCIINTISLSPRMAVFLKESKSAMRNNYGLENDKRRSCATSLNMRSHFPQPSFHQIMLTLTFKTAQGFAACLNRTQLWGGIWEHFPWAFHINHKYIIWNFLKDSEYESKLWKRTRQAMGWELFIFIEYRGKMKWVHTRELPDAIVCINGRSAFCPRFLVNAVRDKEEAGKNKERSFIWTLASSGGGTIQGKGIKKNSSQKVAVKC